MEEGGHRHNLLYFSFLRIIAGFGGKINSFCNAIGLNTPSLASIRNGNLIGEHYITSVCLLTGAGERRDPLRGVLVRAKCIAVSITTADAPELSSPA
jgi:hypothetical protein